MMRTIITATIIIIAIMGVWQTVFHKPLEARMDLQRINIEAERRKLESYRNALAQLPYQKTEYDSVCAVLGLNDVTFSGQDEVVSLYKALDSVCHLPEYKLEEITPSLDEVIQFLRKWESAEARVYIPITIQIEGDFVSLIRLTKNLEESAYFDRLTTAKISGSEELFPDCRLNIAFVAGLNNRLGMLDLE